MSSPAVVIEESIESLLESTSVLLPAKPSLLQEMENLMRDPDFEVALLADCISRDPGVLGALFKLCRSPAYSRGRAPTNAEQVLMLIGLNQTVNLVRGISIRQVAGGVTPQMERFWLRCETIAGLAAQIAGERVAVCNVFPDQAYLAAMFHDSGVALLNSRYPEYWKLMNLDDESSWVDVSLENEHFRLDHASVGYWVARNWGLPDLIVQAIRYHHEMLSDDSLGLRSTIGIIALATHIYLINKGLPDPAWSLRGGEVMEELGIHSSALSEYMDDINESFVTFSL
ncbi:HDOD domain-containing protein [Methyloversatilis thermotolerans]|uniref:HDOD domain-containing protein n=1 Tax=Methyloversatilis thermotolerans TaxID=1346290 RepID=UPI000371B5BC|nr:HDOD domain-containing protein [Methyloversatilis thermotolerans]